MTSLDLYADDLILFAHIVQAGTFTLAAEQTGLPKSTLSRRLSDLENRLGERLMQRSTRRLTLTEFGEKMLMHAQNIHDAAESAADLARNRQTIPQGILRVSLPPEFQEFGVVPILDQFTRRYPQVPIELDLSARRVDLITERFDLAIRAATRLPDDNALVARHLVTMGGGLYASPDYLAQHGTPARPDDLAHHAGLLLIASDGRPQMWRLMQAQQIWEGMPQQRLAANSIGLLRALAEQGHGIAGLSEPSAADLVRQKRLSRVLPDWALPATTLWCVTPGRRLLPQRSLAFIALLRDMLR
ncbi:LysR family transcriptional regulator [Castellaniella sp.]|uniref:LysR family transcriptional regulator n=1 Tax=Castellaniella sp. TaxID=1955812 RepID=UPI0035654DDA